MSDEQWESAVGHMRSDLSTLAQEPGQEWRLALRALARVETLLAQLQRVLDVSPSELRALLITWDTGGLPAGHLSQHIALTAAATTTLVDRLQHRNLVRRTSHPDDGRVVIVQTTPEADKRLANAAYYLQQRIDGLGDGVWPTLADGIIGLRGLLVETATVMQYTPVETFPSAIDDLPVRRFETPW